MSDSEYFGLRNTRDLLDHLHTAGYGRCHGLLTQDVISLLGELRNESRVKVVLFVYWLCVKNLSSMSGPTRTPMTTASATLPLAARSFQSENCMSSGMLYVKTSQICSRYRTMGNIDVPVCPRHDLLPMWSRLRNCYDLC